MDIPHKREWLKQHGNTVRYDSDPDGSLSAVIWKAHGGASFRGTGRTEDEMWEHLFDVVKMTMWITYKNKQTDKRDKRDKIL